jgi:hypothetical protein
VARPESDASSSGSASAASCARAARTLRSATTSSTAVGENCSHTRTLPSPLRSVSGSGK